jgi:hypothetical protein
MNYKKFIKAIIDYREVGNPQNGCAHQVSSDQINL